MFFKNKTAYYGYARSSRNTYDISFLFRFTFMHTLTNGVVSNYQELIVYAVRITNDTDTNRQMDLVLNRILNELTETQNSTLTLYYPNPSENRNSQYRLRESVGTSIRSNNRNIIQSNSRIDRNRLTHILGLSSSLESPHNRPRSNLQPSPYIMVSGSRDMEGISPFDYDHNEHQSRNNICITMHESSFIDIHANRPTLRNAAHIDTTRQMLSRNGVLTIDNHSYLSCSMNRYFSSYPPAVVNQTPNINSIRNTNRRHSYSSNGIIKQKPIVSELPELNRTEDKIYLDNIDKMQRYSTIVNRKTSPRILSRRKRYKPSYNLPDQLDCGLNTATRQDVTGQNNTEQISVSNHNPSNRKFRFYDTRMKLVKSMKDQS